jgi:hypothetical protein
MTRFPLTAILKKSIKSNDKQEMRPEFKDTVISCFRRTQFLKANASIQTDNKIVESFKKDDKCIFDGYEYFIDTIEIISSSAYIGAKEYIINLR